MMVVSHRRRRPTLLGEPDADTLDGHAAYREEREKLEAVGRPVLDDGFDPLRADPEKLVAGCHGQHEGDRRLLAVGLEMLRREHGED